MGQSHTTILNVEALNDALQQEVYGQALREDFPPATVTDAVSEDGDVFWCISVDGTNLVELHDEETRVEVSYVLDRFAEQTEQYGCVALSLIGQCAKYNCSHFHFRYFLMTFRFLEHEGRLLSAQEAAWYAKMFHYGAPLTGIPCANLAENDEVVVAAMNFVFVQQTILNVELADARKEAICEAVTRCFVGGEPAQILQQCGVNVAQAMGLPETTTFFAAVQDNSDEEYSGSDMDDDADFQA